VIMAQNIGQNVANMIQCVAGEHCLFRSFGMGSVVDSPNRITRNSLQVEVNRWFPSVVVDSVGVKEAGSDGVFSYTVNIRGGSNV